MNVLTSYPFFIENNDGVTSYSFLEADREYLPFIRVVSHYVEEYDSWDTSCVNFADYIATGHPDGLRRLLTVLGMYVASDDDQRSMSVIVEALA